MIKMIEVFTVEELISKLNLTENNAQLLGILLNHSKNRLQFFMENYWTTHSEQFFSINNFRKFRQNELGLSKKDFIALAYISIEKALEILFLDIITPLHIKKLNNKLKSKDFNLEVLYDLHKSYPNKNLMLLLK